MASRLQDVILRGLEIDKPLAVDVAPGTLYFSTDTGTLERSNGIDWESYSFGSLSSLSILTADPNLLVDNTCWVVRTGVSPTTLSLRARISGMTVTIASITI